MHPKEDLKQIANNILSANGDNATKLSVNKLMQFFNGIVCLQKDTDDIPLQYGFALSAKHAADCIKDYKRTKAFISGTYQAIVKVKEKFKGEKLNILYAGSGPFAPLVIPILSLMDTSVKFHITVIDVNRSSIDSVKQIISHLNFEQVKFDVKVADAITYKYDPGKKLHMVISETMFHALTREPQVAITNNLKSQLCNGGYFIPKRIELKMGLSFFGKEPYLNQSDENYFIANENVIIKRKNITPLFELGSKRPSPLNKNSFESDWLEIPKDVEHHPDVCVYTTIQVFDDIKLKDSDSLITNPYCVGSLHNLKSKNISRFKIKYTIDHNPNWQIAV